METKAEKRIAMRHWLLTVKNNALVLAENLEYLETFIKDLNIQEGEFEGDEELGIIKDELIDALRRIVKLAT